MNSTPSKVCGVNCPESDFSDPPCTILLDDDGRRLPAEQPDGPWRYDMVERHGEWLINPAEPIGGRSSRDFGGYYSGRAYYFDYAADPDGLANYMAGVLERFSEKSHYNGAFFDYCSSGWKGAFSPGAYCPSMPNGTDFCCLTEPPTFPAPVSATTATPAGSSTCCASAFSRKIDIFANQSFYSYKDYYPAIDHDITESYFVSFAYGRDGKEILVEEKDGTLSPLFTTQTFYRGFKDSITDATPGGPRQHGGGHCLHGRGGKHGRPGLSRAPFRPLRTARTFSGCPKFYFSII